MEGNNVSYIVSAMSSNRFETLKFNNMTKEQILQKHFTVEFGHDGHGKFMQYILDAMEEYAQQQVKNLNIPAVMGDLTCDNCGCHPNVIYTTSKGRFCESCKTAS